MNPSELMKSPEEIKAQLKSWSDEEIILVSKVLLKLIITMGKEVKRRTKRKANA
jgi:hypothetical protein